MRLIDADELKRSISQNNKIPRIFQQVINAQPTVYDIDKIVEELEEVAYVHEDVNSFIDLEDAIEIVKRGCVGTDDVCEWKYPKEIMDNTEFEVSCNSRPLKRGIVPNNFSFYDFKYCPYCGKKIKVVE